MVYMLRLRASEIIYNLINIEKSAFLINLSAKDRVGVGISRYGNLKIEYVKYEVYKNYEIVRLFFISLCVLSQFLCHGLYYFFHISHNIS